MVTFQLFSDFSNVTMIILAINPEFLRKLVTNLTHFKTWPVRVNSSDKLFTFYSTIKIFLFSMCCYIELDRIFLYRFLSLSLFIFNLNPVPVALVPHRHYTVWNVPIPGISYPLWRMFQAVSLLGCLE